MARSDRAIHTPTGRSNSRKPGPGQLGARVTHWDIAEPTDFGLQRFTGSNYSGMSTTSLRTVGSRHICAIVRRSVLKRHVRAPHRLPRPQGGLYRGGSRFHRKHPRIFANLITNDRIPQGPCSTESLIPGSASRLARHCLHDKLIRRMHAVVLFGPTGSRRFTREWKHLSSYLNPASARRTRPFLARSGVRHRIGLRSEPASDKHPFAKGFDKLRNV